MHEQISEQDIGSILQGVNLPSCPDVLVKVRTELAKETINSRKLASMVAQDVGLAALVLKSASSALVGVGRPVRSIHEAVHLLGFGRLTNLVSEGLLRQMIGNQDVSLERFWDNSVHSAAACSELAEMISSIDPDVAHTYGLFHDCGIPLMMQRFPNYKDVLRQANMDAKRIFTNIEDDFLNTNHAAIGYFLARTWSLPENIALAIFHHHDYFVLEGNAGLPDESLKLISIGVLGDHLAGMHLRSQQEDLEWLKAKGGVADYLGFTEQELIDLMDDMLYQVRSKDN